MWYFVFGGPATIMWYFVFGGPVTVMIGVYTVIGFLGGWAWVSGGVQLAVISSHQGLLQAGVCRHSNRCVSWNRGRAWNQSNSILTEFFSALMLDNYSEYTLYNSLQIIFLIKIFNLNSILEIRRNVRIRRWRS